MAPIRVRFASLASSPQYAGVLVVVLAVDAAVVASLPRLHCGSVKPCLLAEPG